MRKQSLLFGDPFKWIRNLPLGKFGRSAIGRLRHNHPARAAFLEPLATAFEAEAGLVLENEELKEVEVASTDAYIDGFIDYVCDIAEGAVRYAAGGKNGVMFREFFPNGKSEYSDANKTTMPLLVQRLRKMAVKYGPALPAEVATKLQSFEASWQAAFEAQEAGKGSITEAIGERSDARMAYVKGLVKTIHEIAAEDPCNEAHGKQYFDFDLLVSRRVAEEAGPAAATAHVS